MFKYRFRISLLQRSVWEFRAHYNSTCLRDPLIRFITPPEAGKRDFVESLVFVPEAFTYQSQDHEGRVQLYFDQTSPSNSNSEDTSVTPPPFTRADFLLPTSPDAVVLACFNRVDKIDPDVFAMWLTILKRVPHAVLWLYVGGKGNGRGACTYICSPDGTFIHCTNLSMFVAVDPASSTEDAVKMVAENLRAAAQGKQLLCRCHITYRCLRLAVLLHWRCMHTYCLLMQLVVFRLTGWSLRLDCPSRSTLDATLWRTCSWILCIMMRTLRHLMHCGLDCRSVTCDVYR